MIIKKQNLYGGNENIFYTTYLIENVDKTGTDVKRLPLAIVCPGGAYLRLSEREAEPVALAFTQNNYHAIVLNYTIHSTGDASYPNPVYDLAKMMSLVHENASEWNVDTDNISLVGFSAGAHLCASLATHWHENWLSEKTGIDSSLLKAKSVVLGYPAVDLSYQKEMSKKDKMANFKPEGQPMTKAQFMSFANKVMTGEDMSEERFKEVSPVNYVSSNTPPTFLWATAEDDTVYVGNTLKYALALEGAGVPFETHVFQKGPHGMALATERTAGSERDIDPEVSVWFDLAVRFIERNK